MPATLLTAEVKYAAGPPRETKYGQRINVLCKLRDGTEFKLWGNPDNERLKAMRTGHKLDVIQDRKGRFKLCDRADSPTQNQAKPATPATAPAVAGDGSQGMSKEAKRAIAGYVEEMANLYKFCWDSARAALDGKAQDEESIRAAASALFISAGRKFGL